MYKNCAMCREDHKEFARQMPNGSTHVYVDAETFARRNAATAAFKARYNATLKAR